MMTRSSTRVSLFKEAFDAGSATLSHENRPRCRNMVGPVLRKERLAPPEVFADVLHCQPANALVRVDVGNQTFKDEQDLGPPGNVRMNGDRKHRIVHFPINPIKLIAPHLLYVARI